MIRKFIGFCGVGLYMKIIRLYRKSMKMLWRCALFGHNAYVYGSQNLVNMFTVLPTP